eukprot:UN26977
MYAIFESFHYFMYVSDYRKTLTKFNPKEPKLSQMDMDKRYTILSILINSAMECIMIHAWGSGYVPYLKTIHDAPLKIAVMLFISPFFRELHFVIYHRILHVHPFYKWFH